MSSESSTSSTTASTSTDGAAASTTAPETSSPSVSSPAPSTHSAQSAYASPASMASSGVVSSVFDGPELSLEDGRRREREGTDDTAISLIGGNNNGPAAGQGQGGQAGQQAPADQQLIPNNDLAGGF
ncbi:hypothetical protein IAT38_006156 [Cryptococcus sp. DSM 104549]